MNTNIPARKQNPPTKEPPTDIREDDRGMSGSHTNLHPGSIWNYKKTVEKLPSINN